MDSSGPAFPDLATRCSALPCGRRLPWGPLLFSVLGRACLWVLFPGVRVLRAARVPASVSPVMGPAFPRREGGGEGSVCRSCELSAQGPGGRTVLGSRF